MVLKKSVPVLIGIAVAASLAVMIPQAADAQKSATRTAPNFSGTASDGKTYSLASIKATKKPTVLYFIGNTCPVNAQAVKYYNNLAEAYKGKVNFIGVIDTDKSGYDKWQNRFKAPYPVVFDPKLTIINAYKAERSPWSVLIDAKGTVIEEWPGFCVTSLEGHSAAMAKAAKTNAVKIDTAGAPKQTRYG